MVLLALILAVAPTFAQEAAPWEVKKHEIIPALESSNLKPIDLQLIVAQGSRWDNRALLEQTIRKASGILSKCGVVLGEADVKTVVFTPKILHDIVTPPSNYMAAESPLMKGDLTDVRPLGFLYGSNVPDKGKAYNLKTIQDYERLVNSGFQSFKPVLNTFHITDVYVDNAKVPGKPRPSYQTFAHELVHLLGNLPHTPEHPNLMTAFEGAAGAKSGDLSEEQCQAIAGWPYTL